MDINRVIEKSLAISRGKIERMVKSFEVNAPQNLPTIRTDSEILEQVLINLLVNAAQAADKEDSWVKLNVLTENKDRGHLIIEVSDNGCGMDDITRKKIFDPFFTTKPAGEGTGLGLYVCHNLLEGLGGRIEVESEPGKGSKFRVILTVKDTELMEKL